MKQTIKTGFAALILLLSISCKKENTSFQSSVVTDINENKVQLIDDKAPITDTVRIGTQVWMKSNLDIRRYRNGDPIPQVRSHYEWGHLITGAWCWDSNDSAHGSVYRKLYNWYAVNDPRGLAPEGWHIPSDSEWLTLATYLGGTSEAGGKMKETDTAHWLYPNYATNSSGFTALPGGFRNKNGVFANSGGLVYFWSATERGYYRAYYCSMISPSTQLYRSTRAKIYGMSVRCIKDSL